MQPTFGESGCVGGWSGWAVPATPSPQPEASSADKPGPPGPVSEASLSPGVGSVSPTQQILRKGSAVVAAPGPGGQPGGSLQPEAGEHRGEWWGRAGPVLLLLSRHGEPAARSGDSPHPYAPAPWEDSVGGALGGHTRLLPNTFFSHRFEGPLSSCWRQLQALTQVRTPPSPSPWVRRQQRHPDR